MGILYHTLHVIVCKATLSVGRRLALHGRKYVDETKAQSVIRQPSCRVLQVRLGLTRLLRF